MRSIYAECYKEREKNVDFLCTELSRMFFAHIFNFIISVIRIDYFLFDFCAFA